jgi:hypothetical protein
METRLGGRFISMLHATRIILMFVYELDVKMFKIGEISYVKSYTDGHDLTV